MRALDRDRLLQALALAEQAIGLSDPNPRVGCVIGHEDGRVLAQGHTQAAGQAHAEAHALQQAQAQGADVRGATAWVTLEPCAHHGRTPPCSQALIDAGIARVVVGVADPFHQVDGRGLQQLRAAGLAVDMADESLALACRELNIGFFARCERGRPWVRMKIAASLDGRTALPDGSSQWITSEAARTDGHAWRRRAGAVLSGIGTVLEDDPRLDVRLVTTARQPLRVVVDSHAMTPLNARLLAPPGEVLVFTAGAEPARERALEQAGACTVPLPDARGKVDLAAMLDDLARRQINELHVEAGHKLNASLLKAGLVDELLVYLAPVLLGDGREMAALGTLARLDQAQRWRITGFRAVGEDLRLLLRPQAARPDSPR
ncbi:MAG: bifunctional diaminohydroxyphosphoribosylaminopyrimidine deaminase/5-amino-6-(5-phosphoribosylamino)uracil reductase RibD [Rubrivivax sp.]|nr:bifunctional diaminohydroxyphosphoribosylaminopyrimidine deaminase/5-amino-6-(5-phosphoribosylamino)uracil reductase RibD [Rubrivivax sp.]